MPGLVEDIFELVQPVRGVDVHHDRADLGGRVLHQGPFRAVRRPDADPVALLDADREQSARHVVDGPAELRIGPAPTARAVHERLAVGEGGHRGVQVLADRVAKQRNIGCAAGV